MYGSVLKILTLSIFAESSFSFSLKTFSILDVTSGRISL